MRQLRLINVTSCQASAQFGEQLAQCIDAGNDAILFVKRRQRNQRRLNFSNIQIWLRTTR